MPVDARIALGVEPVQMPDFAKLAVQRSAVMNNMAEMAGKQRALNEQNTLAQIMQSPDFSFDNPESVKTLVRGAPNLGAGVVKQYQDMQAAQTKAREDARVAKLNETVANVQRLSMFQNIGEVDADIRGSTMDEALKQSLLASLPTDSAQFEPWRMGLLRKATEWMKPESGLAFTDTQVGVGGQELTQRTLTNDPLGAPRTVATHAVTMSPEQQAAAAVARRQAVVAERNATVNERQVAVQEGKAATDAGATSSALGGYDAKVASAKNVLDVVTDLIGGADSPPVFNDKGELVSGGGRIKAGEAGLVGAKAAGIEGTEAFNVASALETIKANLGFDRLQEMRSDPDNKTGGALGQVAVQELERLEATVASAKQGQSLEKLYENVAKIRTHYTNYLRAHEDIDALKQYAATKKGTPRQTVPVVDSQSAYDALPPGAPYRDSSGDLAFKGGN